MSYRRLWTAAILAALLTGLQFAPADANTPASARIDPADLKNITLVKDVKPGMRGYGKSVFRGTRPETFQVEVLGVMRKANVGTDLILVKMSGGPMTRRGANLIEGMSGSPIYLNGKIAGAVSKGEVFGKEPICLVTPIEYMLEAWDKSLPSKPSSFYPLSTFGLDEPIALQGGQFDAVAIDYGPGSRESLSNPDPDTLVFTRPSMPVSVSSTSPRVMSLLREALKPFNAHPVAGAGVAADKAHLPVDLQPGSAVGMSLATGDWDITAVGTVTYRRGNKIVAFGHPMLGLGAVDAPLTSAYVYDVFPSYYWSNRIAMPIKPIGRTFQDRPWSVAGEIGKMANMIPVTVHVNDQSLGRKRDFNVKVINHPMLTASLAVSACAEAIFEMTGSPTDATAKVKLEVVAEEVGTITRENTFFDPTAIEMASLDELSRILRLLQFNPFHPVGIQKVNLWVDIAPKHQTAKLERIFLKESKFEPGDTIEIGAVLKPFKGERVTKTIELELPKNMPSGGMLLQVSGGGTQRGVIGLQDERGPSIISPAIMTPTPTIENLQHLIKKFLEREKNDELVAKIALPQSVPSIAGEKLSGLPPSIAAAMKSPKTTMLGTEREEIKKVVPTEWVVLGTQRLPITIKKVEKSEKKPPERKGPEPPSGPPAEEEPEGPPDEEVPPDESAEEDLSLSTGDFGPQLEELSVQPASPGKSENETPKAASPKEEEPANAGEKPAAKTDTKKAAPAEEKPVGRAPGVWKQTSRTEFLKGTLKNATATTGELLALAGSLQPLYESSEAYVWCLLPDGNGSVYAGTGNHGIIYKVAADGTASVFYDSPELEVHSLATDSGGNVYAGTSPNGIVYKINPKGEASTLLDAEEKYIVALALDSKGNVYAAAGDKCKVYKIALDGKAEAVLDTSEHHALSLAVDKDDNVYVGSAINGIIYKIPAAGAVSILYDAAEDSVTALAVDSNGALLAGTSAKGVLYKLAPDATPKAVYDKAGTGILGISTDGAGNVYAANADSVFKIMPDETVCTLENEHDLQFLSLALDDGRLYAGTGNIGAIYHAEIGKATEGTYESPVHDCGLTSTWGVIEWIADLPKGTSVSLQTRTGYVAEPDSTWSDWSAPYSTPGVKIASPAGRYVQYLATLRTDDASASPKLKDVSIVYLAKNQAPKITLTSPKGGEKWSKKKTIKWTGLDPDKDTLSYEVFYSTDGGTTWEPLGDKIETAAPEKKEEPRNEQPAEEEKASPEDEAIKIDSSDPQQMLTEMAAELDKHPEIPQEVKDKILADAPGMVEAEPREQAVGEPADESSTAEKPPANSTKQTSLSWDTAKFKDGTYLIKVVASDRLSNPIDALTGEAVCEPIIVTNKAPKVFAFKKTLTVRPDKSATVEGFARQELVGIAGVQYKTGTSEWAAAAAADGIFDSNFEAFTIMTQPLKKGEHVIEVKALDQAGNSATTKVTAKVE